MSGRSSPAAPASSAGQSQTQPLAPPSRRDLKSTALWCARWLVGDGKFYQGRVRVVISAKKLGEGLVVNPSKSATGLSLPEALGATPGCAAPVSELLRVLLSDDEKKILAVLAGEPGAKAATVMDRSKVEKSRFWVLWSNLQLRGFVADAERGEGYMVAAQWMRELVAGSGGNGVGQSPAA